VLRLFLAAAAPKRLVLLLPLSFRRKIDLAVVVFLVVVSTQRVPPAFMLQKVCCVLGKEVIRHATKRLARPPKAASRLSAKTNREFKCTVVVWVPQRECERGFSMQYWLVKQEKQVRKMGEKGSHLRGKFFIHCALLFSLSRCISKRRPSIQTVNTPIRSALIDTSCGTRNFRNSSVFTP
jgi:hypothetical protein